MEMVEASAAYGATFGRNMDAVMQLRHVEQAEPSPKHGQGGGARGRLFGLADQAQVTEDTGMLMTTGTHRDQQCRPHTLRSLVCFMGSQVPRTYVANVLLDGAARPDTRSCHSESR